MVTLTEFDLVVLWSQACWWWTSIMLWKRCRKSDWVDCERGLVRTLWEANNDWLAGQQCA